MSEKPPSKSTHLQELIHRRGKVLAVLLGQHRITIFELASPLPLLPLHPSAH
jgi:hypothetical protein